MAGPDRLPESLASLSPSFSHSQDWNVPVIFWVGGEGAFGLEHAVLFFTEYLDPKPLTNQSESVWNNTADEIDFQIFPPSLFGAV